MMKYPNFKIVEAAGRAGRCVKHWSFWNLWWIDKLEPHQVSVWGITPSRLHKKFADGVEFNPYTMLRGGTLLGGKEHNYWFAEDTLLGYIIKRIFG